MYKMLLYGATGYSGRLIASEGERVGMDDGESGGPYRMVLAGRDANALAPLAAERRMEYRVVRLGTPAEVASALADIDVVVNAAGPFAVTAPILARAAIRAGCHYVDINGELDVYKSLADLCRYIGSRPVALVSGAGYTAAASDLLLSAALKELREVQEPPADPAELASVRIALAKIILLSRGSIETVVRSIREQVTVVRLGEANSVAGGDQPKLVLWHEPTGKLERTFDFGDATKADERGAAPKDTVEPRLRIASAANLVDTLTARLSVERRGFRPHRIESYVEAGTIARLAYQAGAFAAPLAVLPWTRDLVRLQAKAFPPGPSKEERKKEKPAVVLEIEDRVSSKVIDWCWQTMHPYDFTARVVIEVAKTVAAQQRTGWLLPSELLDFNRTGLTSGVFEGCRLEVRASRALSRMAAGAS